MSKNGLFGIIMSILFWAFALLFVFSQTGCHGVIHERNFEVYYFRQTWQYYPPAVNVHADCPPPYGRFYRPYDIPPRDYGPPRFHQHYYHP